MLETYNNEQIIVRNYTSNFDVKQYIQEALIPKAFPNINFNKLTLGPMGIFSEYISQGIEDSYATAVLMLNENFITRATLPNSIYSEAALFDLGYTMAIPSRCSFAIELWTDDVIKLATKVSGSDLYQYVLDKDTAIILDNNVYHLDYDIIINFRYINNRPTFEVQYDINERNSISFVKDKFIKCKVTNNGWLVLIVTLQEFSRKIIEETVSDNTVTSNSDIFIKWTNQIAGLDLTYITPTGERLPMIKKIQYSDPERDPFVFYNFYDENTIRLSFSINKNYFRPAFNSKIEAIIYTCHGKDANFDSYNSKLPISVEKTSDRFEYNANTRIVALCYSGSTFGVDKKDIEMLRDDVILAENTVKVLSTDHDLDMWFHNFAKRYDTNADIFKRRDDPTGRLFSQFLAISENGYIYPTNTLTIEVSQDQFDIVNDNNEFVITPGHMWEYKKLDDGTYSRNILTMIHGVDDTNMAFITNNVIPNITNNRPFMFVNPFYIKINRIPETSTMYNYLINNTTFPTETYSNEFEFPHFQLASMNISRSISKEYNNKYIVRILCSPVVSQSAIAKEYKYVNGTIDDDVDYHQNNLRLVMILKSKRYGETGYIEMYPTSISDNAENIEFETIFAVQDNLQKDGIINIDLNNTPDMISLQLQGSIIGQVVIDSEETLIDFVVLLKSNQSVSGSPIGLFNDPSFDNYRITNRFMNDYRELTLYKPLSMMRSVLLFAGNTDNYIVRASLIPFLKYDIPLDDYKMNYFIRAFTEQYSIIEPVLFERLENNAFLDIKCINTYGKSNHYYIGNAEDGILLDSVNIRINFKLSVKDRTAYVQTAESVTNEIKLFFEDFNRGKMQNFYVSNLIRRIEDNVPNVHHLVFRGINDYGTDYQSIEVGYNEVSELSEDQLFVNVPEKLQINYEDIILEEEI